MRYLFLCLLISGCAVGSFPSFPEQIKDHYVTDVKSPELPDGIFYSAYNTSEGEEKFLSSITNPLDIPAMKEVELVRCLHFEIVQKIPYQIKFLSQVPIMECNLVGGYKPKDSVSLYNWIEDVAAWAEKRKHCFRK